MLSVYVIFSKNFCKIRSLTNIFYPSTWKSLLFYEPSQLETSKRFQNKLLIHNKKTTKQWKIQTLTFDKSTKVVFDQSDVKNELQSLPVLWYIKNKLQFIKHRDIVILTRFTNNRWILRKKNSSLRNLRCFSNLVFTLYTVVLRTVCLFKAISKESVFFFMSRWATHAYI